MTDAPSKPIQVERAESEGAPEAEATLKSVARDGDHPDNIEACEALARRRTKGLIVYGV